MNILRIAFVSAMTLWALSVTGVAEVAPKGAATAGSVDKSAPATLSADLKTKIDALLNARMGDFTLEDHDKVLKMADREALVPYLIQILHDENRDWLARQKAASVLIMTRDPRGAEAAVQEIRKYLRPGDRILSHAESEVLHTCIYYIGRCGIAELEDEAFKMLTKEYWSGKGFPIPIERNKELSFTADDLRRSALVGLSQAGTDRAVKAFETGEGIPEDIWNKYRDEMPTFAETARKAREERQKLQATGNVFDKAASSGRK